MYLHAEKPEAEFLDEI
jgi:hypothetical protein